MTDGVELESTATKDETGATSGSGTAENETPQERAQKEEIVDYLSRNRNIFFKSQQIDDPDLTVDEKKSIALSMLNASHCKFLSRFGRYLEREHLKFFESNSYTGDEEYEMKFILKDLRKEILNRAQNVKNRRYAAIKAMMKEDDYFSEKEMMRREPHLYEQLVGQYLTEAEKRARDGYDPKNTPFSQILLENIDKERTEDLRKKQECDEDTTSETASQSSQKSSRTSNTANDDLFPKTPPSYRKQWGNFEEPEASSSTRRPKKEKPQRYITAGEREMLRQEFIGIMHAKFLDGMDSDFDYSKVDDNPELDDLSQIGQDNEDKYFEDDDDEDFEGREIHMEQDDDSDDELDIYMQHLSRHPTVQNNSNRLS